MKLNLDHLDHEHMTAKMVLLCVLESRLAGKSHCFVPIWTAWETASKTWRNKKVLNHALEGAMLHTKLEKLGCRVQEVNLPRGVIARDDTGLEYLRTSAFGDETFNPVGMHIEWDPSENSKTDELHEIWESLSPFRDL